MQEVFLEPGGFFFGGPDVLIKTVLGSCVAVTLWHPGLSMGGVGHFMLPGRNRAMHPGVRLDGRYADEAMEMFCERIAALGTHPYEYQVKLFGGGNMFPEQQREGECADVSCRNVRVARRIVREHGFTVMAEHLGGIGHRALIFDLRDGVAYLRHNSLRPRQVRADTQ